jgi:dihydropteroate synthase
VAGDREFRLGGKTYVMGILNVTPDSFYDGGRHHDREAAVARGLAMMDEGADLVDVGGESSRPGSLPVPDDEQWRRVGPVIEALAGRGVPVSVDTARAVVAGRACAGGACLVNDISGGAGDPDMYAEVARAGAGMIIMHMRGLPATMQEDTAYDDLIGEVARVLAERAAAAREAGVRAESIMLDPGLGFGKSPGGNLALLGGLGRLAGLGYPILVGASRKSFIGHLTGRPPEGRLEGSLAAAVVAAMNGAAMVRVHDVAPTVRALAVADAVIAAGGRRWN